MDELESQYLEVVNRIHFYEVRPLTIEGLEKAIEQLINDMRLVNEYGTKHFEVIKVIEGLKMGDKRMQTHQKIWHTYRSLDTIKILYEFKCAELTNLEMPIPDNNQYTGPLPSNNDRMEEYASV